MDKISSLADVRPGDFYIGDIGGAMGVGVALGEILIGDGFRLGQLSARHIGIVTRAGEHDPFEREDHDPEMAQAMPGGAEVVQLTDEHHWTPKCAYVRLPEDYPGQARDAATVALAMVGAGVAYSPLSYAAIGAAWRGVDPPWLLEWISRRREPVTLALPSGKVITRGFPREAICSVFGDEAWASTGKQVMPEGTPQQLVTPGGMAGWFRQQPGVVWGGAGLLESA